MIFGQVLRRIRHAATAQLLTESQEQTRLMRNQYDLLLNVKWAMAAQDFPNPLSHFGAKFVSSATECIALRINGFRSWQSRTMRNG
jgi:hypothetical protein